MNLLEEYFKDDRLDFDLAHIYLTIRDKRKDTHDIALHLSTYLIEGCSIDELQHPVDFPEGYPDQYQLDVGGLSGINHLTKSHQLAVLACQLAGYGAYRYESCYIGVHDYRCLKEQLEDAEYQVERFRQHGTGARYYTQDTVTYLTAIVDWFAREYSERNPEFAQEYMMEVLKT